MTHLKILELLEDPNSDNDALNTKFYAFLCGVDYYCHDNSSEWGDEYGKPICAVLYTKPKCEQPNGYARVPHYTTSLDAIKAVHDEYLAGWDMIIRTRGCSYWIGAEGRGLMCYVGHGLPTEERARLHAVVRAIEYMRETGDE